MCSRIRRLQLIDGSGSVLRANDNWKTDQRAELEAIGIQPTNDAESALVASLPPGNYTAVVRGGELHHRRSAGRSVQRGALRGGSQPIHCDQPGRLPVSAAAPLPRFRPRARSDLRLRPLPPSTLNFSPSTFDFLSSSSELRTPNSELRTPNSELRTPNSELRNPQSAIRIRLSTNRLRPQARA